MGKLIVCTPTYKRYDLCAKMITSAKTGTLAPDGFIILDNGNNIPNDPAFEGCMIVDAGRNIGVARGWNALMQVALETYGPDVWTLIVNDDIEFLPDTIYKIKAAINELTIEANLDEFPILCGDGVDAPNAFSMFAVQPARLKRVLGWFDETIWPAYYDDNDMHYRMKLKGLELYRIPECGAVHNEGGSATLKSYNEEETQRHHAQFNRNQMYYILKWGGLPGEETYTEPFNNRDLMYIMVEIYRNFGF